MASEIGEVYEGRLYFDPANAGVTTERPSFGQLPSTDYSYDYSTVPASFTPQVPQARMPQPMQQLNEVGETYEGEVGETYEGPLAETEMPVEKEGSTFGAFVQTLARVPENIAAQAIGAIQSQGGASIADAGVADKFYKWVMKRNEELSKTYEGTGDFIPGVISKKDVAEFGPNLAFSMISMGASLAGSIPGRGPTTPVGIAGALAAGGVAAHRMQSYQTMNDWLDRKNQESLQLTGKPITPEAEAEFRKKFEEFATISGLWEAGPEAAGNVLELALMAGRGTLPGKIAALFPPTMRGKIMKALARTFGIIGTEQTTETVTQMGQQRAEVQAGMSDEPMRQWTSGDDWLKSAAEVLPGVLLLSGFMTGAGSAYRRMTREQQGAPPQEETPIAPAETAVPAAAAPTTFDTETGNMEEYVSLLEQQGYLTKKQAANLRKDIEKGGSALTADATAMAKLGTAEETTVPEKFTPALPELPQIPDGYETVNINFNSEESLKNSSQYKKAVKDGVEPFVYQDDAGKWKLATKAAEAVEEAPAKSTKLTEAEIQLAGTDGTPIIGIPEGYEPVSADYKTAKSAMGSKQWALMKERGANPVIVKDGDVFNVAIRVEEEKVPSKLEQIRKKQEAAQKGKFVTKPGEVVPGAVLKTTSEISEELGATEDKALPANVRVESVDRDKGTATVQPVRMKTDTEAINRFTSTIPQEGLKARIKYILNAISNIHGEALVSIVGSEEMPRTKGAKYRISDLRKVPGVVTLPLEKLTSLIRTALTAKEHEWTREPSKRRAYDTVTDIVEAPVVRAPGEPIQRLIDAVYKRVFSARYMNPYQETPEQRRMAKVVNFLQGELIRSQSAITKYLRGDAELPSDILYLAHPGKIKGKIAELLKAPAVTRETEVRMDEDIDALIERGIPGTPITEVDDIEKHVNAIVSAVMDMSAGWMEEGKAVTVPIESIAPKEVRVEEYQLSEEDKGVLKQIAEGLKQKQAAEAEVRQKKVEQLWAIKGEEQMRNTQSAPNTVIHSMEELQKKQEALKEKETFEIPAEPMAETTKQTMLAIAKRTMQRVVAIMRGIKKAGEIPAGVPAAEEEVSQRSPFRVKIISGGQTGADIGALVAGKKLGLVTGGTAPKGWKTEAGANKDLKKYGLTEHDKEGYPSRSMKNVDDAEATIAFFWGASVGTEKTVGYAQTGKWQNGRMVTTYDGEKPVAVIGTKNFKNAVEMVRAFLTKTGAKTINIAGHRETSQKGIEKFVTDVLVEALSSKKSGDVVPAAPAKSSQRAAMKYDMPKKDNIHGKPTTTIDLIREGKRTSTTRSWSKRPKAGDTIEFYRAGKESVNVVVTKVTLITDKMAKDAKFLTEWSSKEGWSTAWGKTFFAKSKQAIKNKTIYQVEFTLAPSTPAQEKIVDKETGKEIVFDELKSTIANANQWLTRWGLTDKKIASISTFDKVVFAIWAKTGWFYNKKSKEWEYKDRKLVFSKGTKITKLEPFVEKEVWVDMVPWKWQMENANLISELKQAALLKDGSGMFPEHVAQIKEAQQIVKENALKVAKKKKKGEDVKPNLAKIKAAQETIDTIKNAYREAADDYKKYIKNEGRMRQNPDIAEHAQLMIDNKEIMEKWGGWKGLLTYVTGQQKALHDELVKRQVIGSVESFPPLAGMEKLLDQLRAAMKKKNYKVEAEKVLQKIREAEEEAANIILVRQQMREPKWKNFRVDVRERSKRIENEEQHKYPDIAFAVEVEKLLNSRPGGKDIGIYNEVIDGKETGNKLIYRPGNRWALQRKQAQQNLVLGKGDANKFVLEVLAFATKNDSLGTADDKTFRLIKIVHAYGTALREQLLEGVKYMNSKRISRIVAATQVTSISKKSVDRLYARKIEDQELAARGLTKEKPGEAKVDNAPENVDFRQLYAEAAIIEWALRNIYSNQGRPGLERGFYDELVLFLGGKEIVTGPELKEAEARKRTEEQIQKGRKITAKKVKIFQWTTDNVLTKDEFPLYIREQLKKAGVFLKDLKIQGKEIPYYAGMMLQARMSGKTSTELDRMPKTMKGMMELLGRAFVEVGLDIKEKGYAEAEIKDVISESIRVLSQGTVAVIEDAAEDAESPGEEGGRRPGLDRELETRSISQQRERINGELEVLIKEAKKIELNRGLAAADKKASLEKIAKKYVALSKQLEQLELGKSPKREDAGDGGDYFTPTSEYGDVDLSEIPDDAFMRAVTLAEFYGRVEREASPNSTFAEWSLRIQERLSEYWNILKDYIRALWDRVTGTRPATLEDLLTEPLESRRRREGRAEYAYEVRGGKYHTGKELFEQIAGMTSRPGEKERTYPNRTGWYMFDKALAAGAPKAELNALRTFRTMKPTRTDSRSSIVYKRFEMVMDRYFYGLTNEKVQEVWDYMVSRSTQVLGQEEPISRKQILALTRYKGRKEYRIYKWRAYLTEDKNLMIERVIDPTFLDGLAKELGVKDLNGMLRHPERWADSTVKSGTFLNTGLSYTRVNKDGRTLLFLTDPKTKVTTLRIGAEAARSAATLLARADMHAAGMTTMESRERTDEFTESQRNLPLTVAFLQEAIPGAEIANPEKGVFTVSFPNGFAFTIRNDRVQMTRDNSGMVRTGTWDVRWNQLLEGIPLMTIAKVHDLGTLFRVVNHEMLHMVMDIFMTKAEQQYLIGRFQQKGDTLRQTLERIAVAYEGWNPGDKVAVPEQDMFRKIMGYARTLLHKLRGLFHVSQQMTPEGLFEEARSGRIFARRPQMNLALHPDRQFRLEERAFSMPVVRVDGEVASVEKPTDVASDVQTSDPNIAAKQHNINRIMEDLNIPPLERSILSWANSKIGTSHPLGSRELFRILLDPFNKEKLKDKHNIAGFEMPTTMHHAMLPSWSAAITTDRALSWIVERVEGKFRARLNQEGAIVKKYPWHSWIATFQDNKFKMDQEMHHDALTKMEDFVTLKEGEVVPLYPLLEWGSLNSKYLTGEELRNPATIAKIYADRRYKGESILSEKQIKAYLQVSSYLKKEMLPFINRSAEIGYLSVYARSLSPVAFTELRSVYWKLMDSSEEAADKEMKVALANKDMTDKDKKDIKRAYSNLRKRLTDLRKMRAEINGLEGYVPFVHGEGKYFVRVSRHFTDKDGNVASENVFTRNVRTITQGDMLIDYLKKMPELQNEGVSTFEFHPVARSTRQTTEEYFQTSDFNMERIIQIAVNKVKMSGELTVDEANRVLDEVLQEIANTKAERGASRSGITRKVLQWEKQKYAMGYNTDSFRDDILKYIFGHQGSRTQLETYIEYMDLLRTIPAGMTQTLTQVRSYMENTLRPSDTGDRWVRTAKGWAYHWFLVGKASMAMLQLTQNFITAIPMLAIEMQYGGFKGGLAAAERYYTKAMLDIVGSLTNMKVLTDKESRMLEYMKVHGYTMARYSEELRYQSLGTPQQVWEKALRALSIPIANMEQYNRRSAALAYYRFLNSNPKTSTLSDEEKYKRIEEYINKTHYWYGKGNLPPVAQGAGLFSKLANVAYTFGPFGHNYALSFYYVLQSHGGPAMAIFAARSFAYLVAFAGIPALPFIDDFLELMEKIFGYPFRKAAKKAVREALGSQAQKLYSSGLIGYMGIDAAAALRPSLPFMNSEGVMGVFSGYKADLAKSYDEAKNRDWLRSFEYMSPTALKNILKAYRLSTRGATTRRENQILDMDLEPVKLTGVDIPIQALGFKPYEYGQIMEDRYSLTLVTEKWKQDAERIRERIKLAITDKELDDAVEEMVKYNESIPEQLWGIIPIMKFPKPQRMDKRYMMFEDQFR
jgi:hypothetical protein